MYGAKKSSLISQVLNANEIKASKIQDKASHMTSKSTISQTLFDDIVRQNIVDLDMAPDEALKDAIDSCKSQDINLTLVVQDLNAYKDVNNIDHKILNLLTKLKITTSTDSNLIAILADFQSECNIDLARRHLAAENGAYDILLNLLDDQGDNNSYILSTLACLVKGQPDLLDAKGLETVRKFLKLEVNDDTVNTHKYLLRFLKECCIKHEINRQNLMKENIVPECMKQYIRHEALISEACPVIRALVLDDDIRVEFGKAHDHAKLLADLYLTELVRLLSEEKNRNRVAIINELMLTISNLLVRNEYCKKADDFGIFDFIFDSMTCHMNEEKINRQALKLLKTLARNDDCKARIRQKNGIGPILKALETHKSSPNLVTIGMQCTSALTLRSAENSKQFFDENAAELIVDLMKLYENDAIIMRNCSWAIRNMASNNKEERARFLELGAEQLLRNCQIKYKNQHEYDFKAALRDLGCAVQFKEEWTGRGGKISTEEQFSD